MDKGELSAVLLGLQPGDYVSVKWDKKPTGDCKECYKKEGVVVQVTKRFAAIRCPTGYTFCVGLVDIACGTVITKKSRRAA